MNPGADVRAIDALKDWHASVCTFRLEASESLSSVAMEIRRAFDWIDDTGREWQHEVRAAEEDVVRCKAELAQRQTPDYSGRIPDTSVQEEALARAKARLRHADEQVEVCRKWKLKLPKLVGEAYEGSARRLTNFLEAELTSATADLSSRIDSLSAYADIKPVDGTPTTGATGAAPSSSPGGAATPTSTAALSPAPTARTSAAPTASAEKRS